MDTPRKIVYKIEKKERVHIIDEEKNNINTRTRSKCRFCGSNKVYTWFIGNTRINRCYKCKKTWVENEKD